MAHARAARLDVECVAQELRRVPRAPARKMLDLLPAGDAGSDHFRVAGRRLHRGGEAPAAQRHRDVVVLLLEAEGAGHATAAGIGLAHLVARPAEGGHRRRGADHRLLMAMTMEERTTRPCLEAKLEPPSPLAQQELLEKEALARHVSRRVGA